MTATSAMTPHCSEMHVTIRVNPRALSPYRFRKVIKYPKPISIITRTPRNMLYSVVKLDKF